MEFESWPGELHKYSGAYAVRMSFVKKIINLWANSAEATAASSAASSSSTSNSIANSKQKEKEKATKERTKVADSIKLKKFEAIFSQRTVDLEKLKQLTWQGAAPQFRCKTWQLLLGYLPTSQERAPDHLARKRREYMEKIPMQYERTAKAYDDDPESLPEQEQKTLHQIRIDMVRLKPEVPLFFDPIIKRRLERLLFIWALHHPASYYVQGMDDLAATLMLVFLSNSVERAASCLVSSIKPEILDAVEADTYWCFTKLMARIQDHYTNNQPGIQRMLYQLEQVISRTDIQLLKHLKKSGISFSMFAFEWMNCLFTRNVTDRTAIRLWDTYLAEEDGFNSFHVYVCASVIVQWSIKLKKLDSESLLTFLKNTEKHDWSEEEVSVLVSQAYVLKRLFNESSSHLKT